MRAKVGAGRRLDAIGVVTKRHQVEIVGEDVLLIQFRIHLGGHTHLAQLAGHGLLGGRGALFIGGGRDQQEVVLDVLLIDGGSALGDAA